MAAAIANSLPIPRAPGQPSGWSLTATKEPTICSHYHQPGQISWKYPNPPQPYSGPQWPCPHCKQAGHWKRDWPSLPCAEGPSHNQQPQFVGQFGRMATANAPTSVLWLRNLQNSEGGKRWLMGSRGHPGSCIYRLYGWASGIPNCGRE